MPGYGGEEKEVGTRGIGNGRQCLITDTDEGA